MSTELKVIIDYLKTVDDFHELRYLRLSKKRSDSNYKTYKLSYFNSNKEEIVMQLDVNIKKEKLSLGLWKESTMRTIKFKNILEYNF